VENEVSRAIDVSQWKRIRDRGQIAKENQFKYTILKLSLCQENSNYRQLYHIVTLIGWVNS
jgi:hypothetical protein